MNKQIELGIFIENDFQDPQIQIPKNFFLIT